jgi:hypothetical protein
MTDKFTPNQVEWFKDYMRLLTETVVFPIALDLCAARTVLDALKVKFPDLDVSLASARQQPAVLESVQKKYRESLETLLQSTSAESLQTEVEKWLRAQKQTDSNILN